MTRYFFVSDIHSYYSQLIAALEAVGFEPMNEKHVLVVLGDVFDRGRQSWRTYQFLKHLPNKILVRGNHEDLLIDMVKRGFVHQACDIKNGTADTCLQLATEDVLTTYVMDNFRETATMFTDPRVIEVCQWINEEFVDFIEFSDLIGVHAGIPLHKDDYVGWPKVRWCDPYIDRDVGKWRITGHWFAAHHWKRDGIPWMQDQTYISKSRRLIGIDSCVMLSGRINVFVYETDEKPILGKSYNEWMEGWYND